MSTCRSRSPSAASTSASAWQRSETSTSSSGSGPSPATKSPKTASSVSPTGWSRLVDARAAAFTSWACAIGRFASSATSSSAGSRPGGGHSGRPPPVCFSTPPRGLLERRLAAELRPERALCPVQLLHPLDDVHRHPNRAGLVGERPGDGLADPPRGVRRELVPAAPVELLDGADQAERPFLDQVEEREALVAVVLRNRDDEAQIGLDHPRLRRHLAALDALGELDLLRRRQQRVPAGIAQEELERVGGRLLGRDRLRRRWWRGRRGLSLLRLGLEHL